MATFYWFNAGFIFRILSISKNRLAEIACLQFNFQYL
jgi:hypothetical protein